MRLNYILFLIAFLLVLTPLTCALPDDAENTIDFTYPDPPTNYSEVNVNHSNTTDKLITNIGTIDDVNDTQFNINAEQLDLDESWLTSFGNAIWCALTGCTMSGDIGMGLNDLYNAFWVNASFFDGDGRFITNIGESATTKTTRNAVYKDTIDGKKCQCVYISGATGDKPEVMLCNNQGHASSHIWGILGEDATFDDEVFVRLLGDVTKDGNPDDCDTSAFAEGCNLHITEEAGNLSCDVQQNGSHVHAGITSKSNSQTGIIETVPQPYIHDLSGTLENELILRCGGENFSFISIQDYNGNVLGTFNCTNNLFNWTGNTWTGGNSTIGDTAFINKLMVGSILTPEEAFEVYNGSILLDDPTTSGTSEKNLTLQSHGQTSPSLLYCGFDSVEDQCVGYRFDSGNKRLLTVGTFATAYPHGQPSSSGLMFGGTFGQSISSPATNEMVIEGESYVNITNNDDTAISFNANDVLIYRNVTIGDGDDELKVKGRILVNGTNVLLQEQCGMYGGNGVGLGFQSCSGSIYDWALFNPSGNFIAWTKGLNMNFGTVVGSQLIYGVDSGSTHTFKGDYVNITKGSLTIGDGDDLLQVNGDLNVTGDSWFGSLVTSITNIFGTTRLGNPASNNFSEFETDGTLRFNGSATVYNDLSLPLDSAKVPAANAPNWESFVGNLNAYAYDVNDYQEFTTELLHDYQEGSDFQLHIHGALNAALAGGDETVKFEIEYSIANMDATDGLGDVFPATTTISSELIILDGTADLTQIFMVIGIDSVGTYEIGATIKGRVRRIASSGTELVGDMFLTQVGIHHEVDTIGSRLINTKS